MFRVLIVDDEPSVLEGLRLMIPWEELGLMLCGEASNGRDALDKLEKLQPHLLITDIRMPFQNGLDLILAARKQNTEAEFIILSGYTDFAYAQTAMRYQVRDYLLKPLDREEIIATLRKIIKRLQDRYPAGPSYTKREMEAARSRAEELQTSGGIQEEAPHQSLRSDFDEELAGAVRLMNRQEAQALTEELFAFFHDTAIGIAAANAIVDACVYQILRVAAEKSIPPGAILDDPVRTQKELPALQRELAGIVSRAIRLLLEHRRKDSRAYLYETEAFVRENFDQELSISFLAAQCYLDAGHLGEAFRKQFGCSIKEYQHRLRIEQAMKLMQTTQETLADIAQRVGYNNYNNFFAHFTRIAKCRPTECIRT